jgi:hypothetical protein
LARKSSPPHQLPPFGPNLTSIELARIKAGKLISASFFQVGPNRQKVAEGLRPLTQKLALAVLRRLLPHAGQQKFFQFNLPALSASAGLLAARRLRCNCVPW